MNRDDYQSLYAKLDELWPNKIKPDVKREFCERLERFPIDAVVKELGRWAAEKFWPPKTGEIVERLRKTGAAVPTQLYRTVIAQGVASANPQLNGRSETELIVRYHRYWFFRYRASVSKLADAEDLAGARRAKHERECYDDVLAAINVDSESDDKTAIAQAEQDARNAAAWIDADKASFDNFARELGEQKRPAERNDQPVPDEVASIFT